MQESQETHISNHLDEVVAAVSINPRKKIQNKLPQTVLFQPPREKLHLCEEKAKSCFSSHQYKQGIHELSRCIALTRICYGDSHWKLAEAHISLAQGYLLMKGFSLQAKQHAEKAKEILTDFIVPPYDDNTDVFKCSVELFHTLGRAFLSLQKVYHSQKKSQEALPHYQEALEYVEISKGEESPEYVSILRELAGAEQALGFHNTAINHFLQAHVIILGRSPSQEEAADSAQLVARAAVASRRPEHHGHLGTCTQKTHWAVRIEMYEECKVRSRRVRRHCVLGEEVGTVGFTAPNQVLFLTTKCPASPSLEALELHKKLGTAMPALGSTGSKVGSGKGKDSEKPVGYALPGPQESFKDVAEKYFQESMAHFKNAEGAGNTKFLAIQDEFCHFLQITGQKERATLILKESLEAKVEAFGYFSLEVAETYKLVGGADLAQGNHSGAHKNLKKLCWRKTMAACSKTVARGWSKVVGESRDGSKDIDSMALGNLECLQIQSLLYGPQNKKTVATQQSVDILSRAREGTTKPRQSPKAKVAFCTSASQRPSAPRKGRPNLAD
ncbi:Tetratricopeptide repeat protein 23 [Heterocephalus glaber]|uniref:Tetratricopeptide repeat protein 23 n=1 Tax=Heterocephalus glaber TaxID=10181 RepID=G5ARY2_HETGA|nr:Tetratricopeptide repeat protein 23 [Heterocephalus glaber]